METSSLILIHSCLHVIFKALIPLVRSLQKIVVYLMLVAWNPLPLHWISAKAVDLFSSHSHDIHIAAHHDHTAIILKHDYEDAS
jgi:hypothetical protein